MGRLKRGLVFANTKRVVDDIVDGLLARGYSVDRLHGDMPQTLRERVMDSFRKGNLNVLVATDIAARGLDIDDVDVVVNMELPRDPEDYVHRIGRTARAGRKGKAVTFIGRRDFSLLSRIERFIGTRMERKQVMTAEQVEQARRESLVDDILENAAKSENLPEELRDIDMPQEKLLAAMFNLLTQRSTRELQDIPEDRPSRHNKREKTSDSPIKEKAWADIPETVTLFMNGGKLLGIRPKDIAGLLYNEGGAPKGTVGDIKIFLKHSLIEVSPDIAPQLIETLATCNICGYEVNVREDKGKPDSGNSKGCFHTHHTSHRNSASYGGRGTSNFSRDHRSHRSGRYESQDRQSSRSRRHTSGSDEPPFYSRFTRKSRH